MRIQKPHRGGHVPSRLSPRHGRAIELGVAGESAQSPILCGDLDDSDPVLIVATSLAFGIRPGSIRWVTGSEVDAALADRRFVRALVWVEQGDATVDGLWSINSEQTRGEPRIYWIDRMPDHVRAYVQQHDIDTARVGGGLKPMRALCQRLAVRAGEPS